MNHQGLLCNLHCAATVVVREQLNFKSAVIRSCLNIEPTGAFQECNNELIIRILNSLARSKNTDNGFRFRKINSLLHSRND